MAREDSLIGAIGVLSVATRGQAGPGEVMVKIRGGSEAYIAWSPDSAAQGRDGSGHRIPGKQDGRRQRVDGPAEPLPR